MDKTQSYLNGKKLREKTDRLSLGDFKISDARPAVLEMMKESNKGRLRELIPIRHARMSASPFVFYRATAGIMAYDLSSLPSTKLNVQAIGDCHLMNFGGFATPERTLIFDANDFDETNPCSWEWDVKRLATSFVLAARNKGLNKTACQEIALSVTRSYRENIRKFADISMLDLWYTKFDMMMIWNKTKGKKARQIWGNAIIRANEQTPQKSFYKLIQNVSGTYQIADQPPLIYHPAKEKDKDYWVRFIAKYKRSLQADRRHLMNNYELVDVAVKVVGVGSVGTRCYVALLMNEKQEPLFLQVKEASASVLEPYVGKSIYKHGGERVVQGQRLTQAASDIFLGWSTGKENRHYYIRQLRDKKISPDVAHFNEETLNAYAHLCGRMLARAHAKTGNAHSLSGYMGDSERLDEALAKFAFAYADQTEKDYDDFMKAIKAGKLPVEKT